MVQSRKFEIMLPNERKNLVNLSNSFLKEMGIKPLNDTLKEMDEELAQKNYKNIILILYDGMGSAVLNRLLIDSFLRAK